MYSRNWGLGLEVALRNRAFVFPSNAVPEDFSRGRLQFWGRTKFVRAVARSMLGTEPVHREPSPRGGAALTARRG